MGKLFLTSTKDRIKQNSDPMDQILLTQTNEHIKGTAGPMGLDCQSRLLITLYSICNKNQFSTIIWVLMQENLTCVPTTKVQTSLHIDAV